MDFSSQFSSAPGFLDPKALPLQQRNCVVVTFFDHEFVQPGPNTVIFNVTSSQSYADVLTQSLLASFRNEYCLNVPA
jgi:hypothetical protein